MNGPIVVIIGSIISFVVLVGLVFFISKRMRSGQISLGAGKVLALLACLLLLPVFVFLFGLLKKLRG